MPGNIFHRNVMAAQRIQIRKSGFGLSRKVTPDVAPSPHPSVAGPRRRLLGRGTA